MSETTQPMPAITNDDDDGLMTTYAVAMLFNTTSVQVVRWTQRNDPPLHPVVTDNGRRFRRTEVAGLYASGFRGEPSTEWRKNQERPTVPEMHGNLDSTTPEPLPFPDLPESPLFGRWFVVTSHRKPKPVKQRKAPKVRLPSITLPSVYTLLGCTPSGRIMGFKTGWYRVESEPVDEELAEW